MRVEPLIPDVAPSTGGGATPQASAFSAMLDDLGAVLSNAQRAEDSFASGTGDLQSAIYERARADVALSVATAAAQRTTQALQSVLNMQV
jgi:flagellar hook-basal body complex protein FliE